MGPSQFWKELVLLLTRSISHRLPAFIRFFMYRISSLFRVVIARQLYHYPVKLSRISLCPFQLLFVLHAQFYAITSQNTKFLFNGLMLHLRMQLGSPSKNSARLTQIITLRTRWFFKSRRMIHPCLFVLTQPYQEPGPEMQEDPDQLLDDNLRRSTQVTKPPVWMEDYTN